jgi:hypothetical protein
MEHRTATIHEVPDAVKHECWIGKPLFIACVYEGRHILDTHEGDSTEECSAWLRDFYPETQRERAVQP